MTQRDNRHGNSYDVGYGKPPITTRFVKGQSGNPLGRPRKKKPEPLKPSDATFLELFTQEAYRQVTLRENGQPIELPVIKAAMRSTWADAIKGKRLSQKYAFAVAQLAEAEREKLESSKYEWLWDLKARGRRITAECNRLGRPVPELYPHPDDIIVDPLSGKTHVDGPLSREHADYYTYIAAARDFLLLFSELLRRENSPIVVQHPDGKPICRFLVLAHVANSNLPTRYRWSKVQNASGFDELLGNQSSSREDNPYDDQGFALMREHRSLPIRELRRRAKAEFSRIRLLESKCPNLVTQLDDKTERMIRRLYAKWRAEKDQSVRSQTPA